MDDMLLVCATETTTHADIEDFAEALTEELAA
jgi:glycine cleavage system pyridoxal-binding protein P